MNPQDGWNMDPRAPGSGRRAREPAGLPMTALGRMDEEPQMARPTAPRQPPMGSAAGQPRAARPQAPFALQTRDGQIGVPISKPTRIPQWPLQEPQMAPPQVDGAPYQPRAGSSQPPQRPPRPSRVPSILDASKVQDHTPVFQYQPQPASESSRQDLLAVPETPSDPSRSSTVSSTASIPDFPLPIQVPAGAAVPSRRSVNLGPPPSARRGASSFYSNASFVSPIPEESPRSRSHASFASSTAIPENWGTPSPGPSPDYPDPIYTTIMEESTYGDDDAEESRLVRSASIGKRAKPTLVSAYGDDKAEEGRLVRSASIGKRAKPTLVSATASRAADGAARGPRPGPQPVQADPFQGGTGYIENSSSSDTPSTAAKAPVGSSLTADSMLGAFASASADDPSSPSARTTPPPNPLGGRPYSRLSAMRRPPRLDIDAVRKAEARGSLTSLPDLIRRATRLASNLERGNRPASRFDDLGDFPAADFYGAKGEKHRSGLSDMLAAFPPPAQAHTRRSFRDSLRDSWPLPLNLNRSRNTGGNGGDKDSQQSKKGRRCCGLPFWGFMVLLIAALIVIVAAVVLPLEFLVFRKQDSAQEALQKCQQELVCANGGTNVVDRGVCSCICTNGFTGPDCTVTDDTGCTSIALAGAENVADVTIGDALPRLIQQAQANFSIPLSGTQILATLNAGNLSCSAENALVTFNGHATRQDTTTLTTQAINNPDVVGAAVVDGVLYTTITIIVAPLTTFTVTNPLVIATQTTTLQTSVTWDTTTTTTTPLVTQPPASATSTLTTTMSMSSGTPMPSDAFVVTEEVLDFARVAVLYVLQEEGLGDAEAAQVALQRFFKQARTADGGVSVDAARSVSVGAGGREVDLVDLAVDLGGGEGRVGGTGVEARAWMPTMRLGRRGGKGRGGLR